MSLTKQTGKGNDDSMVQLKEKIKQKEQEIIQLNNESEERNQTINEFITAMNDLCLAHEKACKCVFVFII